MKQIWYLAVGFAAAFAITPVWAEDLTAGKTPAQLFRSDCGECHRSPNGLARNPDVRALASFLREHYTTKTETAGALAAYVSGFASAGQAARNRGAAPAPRERSRFRSEAEAEDAPPRLTEEPAPRHRRAANPPTDRDKRRPREESDAPRPPRAIGTASPRSDAQRREPAPRIQEPDSSRTRELNARTQEPQAQPAEENAQARISQPEADDQLSRLRGYVSSGMNSESAIAEASGTGARKARRRRNGADVQTGSKADTDEPAAMPGRADPPAETSPAEPQQ